MPPFSPRMLPAPSQTTIVLNLRAQGAGLTGVQRYTSELLPRLGERLQTIAPRHPLHGMKGHLWEQLVLPRLVGGRLLWSPANSGPLRLERQVVTVHDVAVLDHPEWFKPCFAAWYRWLIPALVKRAYRVITVSEFSRLRLLKLTGVQEGRVVVIANGVDSRFRPCSPVEVAQTRRFLNLPSANYLLSLGTLEPRKNLSRLLKAWELALPHLARCIWLVVAGASGTSRVFGANALIKLPPRVHLAGFVPDDHLPALYSGALGFAYVSLYEGFGLPVLEAMACGTPSIVSAATALPALVEEAGLQVDPRNPQAIAEAIARICNDSGLRRELSRHGRARSLDFTWDRAAELTWKELEQASSA